MKFSKTNLWNTTGFGFYFCVNKLGPNVSDPCEIGPLYQYTAALVLAKWCFNIHIKKLRD